MIKIGVYREERKKMVGGKEVTIPEGIFIAYGSNDNSFQEVLKDKKDNYHYIVWHKGFPYEIKSFNDIEKIINFIIDDHCFINKNDERFLYSIGKENTDSSRLQALLNLANDY